MIKDFITVKRVGLLIGFMLSLVTTFETFASHLRAGEITVERINCIALQFRITITVYTNTASPVVFGGDGILYFGDGFSEPVPEILSRPAPALGPNIGIAQYVKIYTYSGRDRFTISYVEPNRNGGVLNMYNSFFTKFYLETQIDLAVLNCSNSPRLEIPPIDQACSGVAFYHNPGAVDDDLLDSLSYEMVIPFQDKNQAVFDYRDPNNSNFYSGLNYNESNETNDGPPTFSIDPVNGTLVWDAPGAAGEYNIAFHVKEWRKINGVWSQIGYVRRDMQIIVNNDCMNDRPLLDVPLDTCVVAGATLHKYIKGVDPNDDDIKIQAFSEVFSLDESRATRTPVLPDGNGNFKSSPDSILFNWNTTCAHVKGQPYQVTFKITDKPDLGPKLVTFQTWQITVVAPPPVLDTVILHLPERHAELQWDSYTCYKNASAMQIWRRVDKTVYTPGNCDTGMPEGLGFTLVAQIPIRGADDLTEVTSYLDTNNGKGLESGAQYCYRLVAVFQTQGAESYVSNEECVGPIETSAPIITNVTVDKTGETDGQITVTWIAPLEQSTYLPPYSYKLQRVKGNTFVDVTNGVITQKTAIDDGADLGGLNTRDTQYLYRVLLYSDIGLDGDLDLVDSTSVASSVWLDLSTQKQQINLNWSASVPWSNQLQGQPHDIYRGPEGATSIDDFTGGPIASVNVTVDGLRYEDHGQDLGVPLDSTTVYCYLVVTRGGYGNPEIPTPLINYSQINCATPQDNKPPCKPQIQAFANSCEDFITDYGCASTSFDNTISWSVLSNECEEDIRSYTIYRASSENGTYSVIKTGVRDTFFVDEGLASLARCYRIAAVDRSGNEGELSNPICKENCPYYELPNVFSPNGDGCNDLFSAYGVDLELGDDNPCFKDPDEARKCARFVISVTFKVFNRWGKKIYEYTGQRNNENSIYIKWDGRDSSGKELATGVYYYSAEVTFDSTRPNGTVKTLKGWVHLVR